MDPFLHRRPDFSQLIQVVAREKNILPLLVEKDYWIMQALYGLKQQGFGFQLKGGTSLSKGFGLIDRFSEDIDLQITPPAEMEINPNPNANKPGNVARKKAFYDWLAAEIRIDGIVSVKRDHEFDNPKTYNSGGIRLLYEPTTDANPAVKEGILLEVGFDKVTPNRPVDISSWAYDKAASLTTIEVLDNRSLMTHCYDPGYTLVEKLQTICTKFRKDQETDSADPPVNFMRQYYDVYCLLGDADVRAFIGTGDYESHKTHHFPKQDLQVPLAENEALRLSDPGIRKKYSALYARTAALYYNGQPPFDTLMERIGQQVGRL